jgi:tetratricopeptide (TPR) repeat protein
MEDKSRSVALCIAGIAAEFERRVDDARALYRSAWDSVADDYDACVAAHYVAHLEADPHQALEWNIEALRRAEASVDDRIAALYPSLYVNLGRSYELTGDAEKSREYYKRASMLGLNHGRSGRPIR